VTTTTCHLLLRLSLVSGFFIASAFSPFHFLLYLLLHTIISSPFCLSDFCLHAKYCRARLTVVIATTIMPEWIRSIFSIHGSRIGTLVTENVRLTQTRVFSSLDAQPHRPAKPARLRRPDEWSDDEIAILHQAHKTARAMQNALSFSLSYPKSHQQQAEQTRSANQRPLQTR